MLATTCGLAFDEICTAGAEIMDSPIISEKMTANPVIITLWLNSRFVLFTEKIRELNIYDFLIS